MSCGAQKYFLYPPILSMTVRISKDLGFQFELLIILK